MKEKDDEIIRNNLVCIVRRLDALIALSLLQISDKVSARDQIKILNQAGLKYGEIAPLLGRSSSYVASELTVIKKKKEKSDAS
jgi:hypothetical protein